MNFKWMIGVVAAATTCASLGIPLALGMRAQVMARPGAVVPTRGHKIVLHVASDDVAAMSHAVSTADNAMKFYKTLGEPVAIEIVANGSGVRMMRSDTTPIAPSIAYLHRTYPAIVLSACGTTLSLMAAREGVAPPLLDGVRITPAGIARVVELEEAGWSYVRP